MDGLEIVILSEVRQKKEKYVWHLCQRNDTSELTDRKRLTDFEIKLMVARKGVSD